MSMSGSLQTWAHTRKIPPFADFPYALKDIIEGPAFYLDGGLEIDGREISALNPEQIKDAASAIVKEGIQYVAVVGVFSALDQHGLHEDRCRALLKHFEPGLSVVCSGQIGGTGLLTRENATILNAAILGFAQKTIRGFRLAMSKLDLSCPLYLTQNDGTLTDAAVAAELPIKTFASGPTNSLMGAAFLQGLDHGDKKLSDKQVVVVDIGGTTTDVCSLLPSGFPRQAPNFVEVGGVPYRLFDARSALYRAWRRKSRATTPGWGKSPLVQTRSLTSLRLMQWSLEAR